jgi:tripartite-type tricarboxylate transporter receptor subunit TctC
MVVWYALFAPAGTPKPIIDKVVAALRTAGHDPDVIAKMSSWDATIYDTKDVTPDVLRATMSSNVTMWTQLIQSAGLTPQ